MSPSQYEEAFRRSIWVNLCEGERIYIQDFRGTTLVLSYTYVCCELHHYGYAYTDEYFTKPEGVSARASGSVYERTTRVELTLSEEVQAKYGLPQVIEVDYHGWQSKIKDVTWGGLHFEILPDGTLREVSYGAF
jgi:hypothetical protein